MKSSDLKALLTTILAFATFAGCNQPRLFEAKENSRLQNQSPLRGSNGDQMVNVTITGGFAGINKQLTIDSNGFVRLADYTAGSTSYTDYLSATEFADLIARFVAADFFHLNDHYMTEGAADLFFYDLTFTQNGASKRVVTDHLTAPRSLQEIIEALGRIIDALVENNLQLTLTASRDTFRIGETVMLTLGVANLSNAPVTLYFPDGQEYDFYAISPSSAAVRAPTKEWNWAHEKVFTQATQTIILAAGERKAYDIEWNGLGNNRQQLTGSVLVAAELVSVPGGSTQLLPLQIIQ